MAETPQRPVPHDTLTEPHWEPGFGPCLCYHCSVLRGKALERTITEEPAADGITLSDGTVIPADKVWLHKLCEDYLGEIRSLRSRLATAEAERDQWCARAEWLSTCTDEVCYVEPVGDYEGGWLILAVPGFYATRWEAIDAAIRAPSTGGTP